jgi:hypothetical protein
MRKPKGYDVDAQTLRAFGDELSKIAGFFSWIAGNTQGAGKAKLRVAYHFSPKAGEEKWVKFLKNISDPGYLDQLSQHPEADPQLLQHAKSLHDLSKAPTVGKVYSVRLPGRSYEVKKLQDGTYGCTCPDWRYIGSLQPGYECKHIRAHKAGKVKAED